MDAKSTQEAMRPVPVRRRTGARLGAIQLTFQQVFSARDVRVAVADFLTHYAGDLAKELKVRKIDSKHFQQLCLGMASHQDEIDQKIAEKLTTGWTVDRLARADFCVLRAGVYELCFMPHVPAKAVLSEYAAVADAFQCDVQFVNAVLDQIARSERKVEMTG